MSATPHYICLLSFLTCPHALHCAFCPCKEDGKSQDQMVDMAASGCTDICSRVKRTKYKKYCRFLVSLLCLSLVSFPPPGWPGSSLDLLSKKNLCSWQQGVQEQKYRSPPYSSLKKAILDPVRVGFYLKNWNYVSRLTRWLFSVYKEGNMLQLVQNNISDWNFFKPCTCSSHISKLTFSCHFTPPGNCLQVAYNTSNEKLKQFL